MKINTTWLVLTVLFCSGFTLSHSQGDGDLRLAGFGSNPSRGKLEVFYNGEWGRVCSENTSVLALNTFHFQEATVVCRQLGFGFALNYYVSNSLLTQSYRYGRGSSSFLLDQVQCDGTESHILRCSHGVLGNASETCQDFHDITVECSDVKVPYYGELRLTDGPSGTLELFSDDAWGAICFEGGFGGNQANAVCRQLGYTGATSHNQLSADAYEGFYWDLQGAPLADTQQECFTSCLDSLPTVRRNTTGCTPVYVQCAFNTADATTYTGGNAQSCALTPEAPFNGDLRYVNSALEVYLDNEWSGVCGDNSHFYPNEAEVICKAMGFPAGKKGVRQTRSQDSLKQLICWGFESSIEQCHSDPISTEECEQGVSVECFENEAFPYGVLTIYGGIGTAGQLIMNEYYIENNNFRIDFGNVCDDSFTMADAQVACRQMGYRHAISFNTDSYYGDAMADFVVPLYGQCQGDEDHLLNCKQVSPSPCTSLVGIQCATSISATPAVRLVDGNSSSNGQTISGLLEVNIDGNWGPVGDTGFDHLAAHVVCTQLGYPTAKQVHDSSRFGGVSGSSYALNGVQCNGHESTALDCQYLIGVNEDQSQEQAALECSETFPVPEGSFRLTSGSNLASGILEISVHGVWMSVCGASFTEEAANLACRDMGFERVESYCDDSCFGESSSEYTFYMNDLCTLTAEGSLLACDSGTHEQDSCNGTIGLICVPMVTDPPPTTETELTMTETVSMETTTEDPTTSTIIPGLQDMYFYIVVGVVGALLVFLVLIIVCCICCCVARRRKRARATWRSATHMNGGSGARNGHTNTHHPNGTNWSHVESNSKLKMEKVGDLDDPRDAIEMNGFTHTPSTGTDSDPNLDYKQELSLDLEQERNHHYENLPGRVNVLVSNTLYVEEGHSPASPPPGYDELEFLPSATST